MKLWKVYIYNYFGELSRCWYFSSRVEANECGEYFSEAMDGVYDKFGPVDTDLKL